MMRQAFASLAVAARPTSACPEPERLWDAVRGEATPEEAQALVAHTAACAACAEAWRLARDLAGALPSAETLPRRRLWWGGWGALAAAVAAAAASAWVLRVPLSTPVYRGETAAPRSLVSEARPIPRERLVLRWTPGPEGSRYDVLVATEGLVPLHRARDLSAPEHRVPAEALVGLPAGARVLWRVEAVLPDGTRVASATFLALLK